MAPFNEVEEISKKYSEVQNPERSLRPVGFEMYFRHPNGDVQDEFGVQGDWR